MMHTILVIDDDPFFRSLVQSTLMDQGYRVIEADGGEVGLKLACDQLPDLIVSDLYMANGDGYSVLRGLSQSPVTAAIPIIIMTGQGDQTEIRRGMELGADDFLLKPFTQSALLAAVTARLKRQHTLRQLAEHTKTQMVAILEATTDLVWIADSKTHQISYLNQAGRTFLGLGEQDDLLSVHIDDFHSPEVWEFIQQEALPLASENGIWTGETGLVNRGGEEIPISQLILTHKTGDGSVDFLSSVMRDLTHRKRLEGELIQERELLHALLDNMPSHIYFKDEEGRFKRVNRSMARLFNMTDPALLIGKTDFDFFAREHAQKAFEDERQIMRTGEPIIDVEEEENWPDGRITWVLTSKMPLRDPQGRIIGTFGISRDITERKLADRQRDLMEVQLRQAQKLESIGQLAAGIAHEINTPTQYIGDNARFLLTAFQDLARLVQQFQELLKAVQMGGATPELAAKTEEAVQSADLEYLLAEIPKAVQQSLDGVERVGKIVRAMKEFSHPGSQSKTPTDLNHAIESTVTVARNEWKYVADLELDLDRSLPLVPCLPGEFNQVILNLVINASHAIGDVVKDGAKGKIVVSTRLKDQWAEINIRDSGTGIPEKIRDKIFDPFFTTKPVGRGTGQGLAISRSVVVDKHRGSIRFETETGRGTTFVIRLPINGAEDTETKKTT